MQKRRSHGWRLGRRIIKTRSRLFTRPGYEQEGFKIVHLAAKKNAPNDQSFLKNFFMYREAEHADFVSSFALNLLPDQLLAAIGWFNVFDIEELPGHKKCKRQWAHRRPYFTAGLLQPAIKDDGNEQSPQDSWLVFGIPGQVLELPEQEGQQAFLVCVFTADFLTGKCSDVVPGYWPAAGGAAYRIGGQPALELEAVFRKMQAELASSYLYKYDLLRQLLLQVIHYGLKLQSVQNSC